MNVTYFYETIDHFSDTLFGDMPETKTLVADGLKQLVMFFEEKAKPEEMIDNPIERRSMLNGNSYDPFLE